MNQKPYFILLALLVLSTHTLAQITVRDEDLKDGDYTWTADNIYLLDGFVFLESGGTLTIEPGTIIKGSEDPSTNDNTSALIITRGAQIFAEGTAEQPIIFTSRLDDTHIPDDLEFTDRGIWGGLIILGNAVIANATSETRVEGIPEGESRALFGGTNDEDNSGILRYVSIRHGGAELAPGDEINGLTLGAVGSGTVIEHIEVISNADDGIEFFGGTVGVKYATVAFCGDDAFDWDLGYRGKGQFWFALLGENDGDNAGELDGAGGSDDNEPHSSPNIFNATFIGAGCDGVASNATATYFRDGGGGKFQNSIFTQFIHALEVEDKGGVDSRQRLEEGSLVLENNLWWGFCNGTELNGGTNGIIRPTSGAEDVQWLVDYLTGAGNTLEDPELSIAYDVSGNLDPRPGMAAMASANEDLTSVPDDNFYTPVCFKGAFLPNVAGNDDVIWLEGWTALSEYGALNPTLDFANPETVDNCLVGVEEFELVDKGYILTQNVPNPFGSITEITFTLPQKDVVTLAVYDMTGRQIARLIDAEEQLEGTYKVEFNGSNLPNGLYYYNLTTQHVSLTKELVIVK